MTTSPATSLVRLALIIPLIALVGCGGASKRTIDIEGPTLDPGRALGVDVTNFNGPVTIRVGSADSDPQVKAKLRAKGGSRLAGKKAQKQSVWIGAEMVEQEGGLVMRVLSRPDPDVAGSDQVRVALKIRIPDCDGVLVRTSGGAVKLIDVDGAIQVENGIAGADGGPIDVRTDADIQDPIALTTTDGDVYLQVGPNAEGRFEVVSENGDAVVRVHDGSLSRVEVSENRWTGVINGGDNPILLRTSDGTARLLVLKEAATSRPTPRPR